MDKIAVLNELQRQEEVHLALKVRSLCWELNVVSVLGLGFWYFDGFECIYVVEKMEHERDFDVKD